MYVFQIGLHSEDCFKAEICTNLFFLADLSNLSYISKHPEQNKFSNCEGGWIEKTNKQRLLRPNPPEWYH